MPDSAWIGLPGDDGGMGLLATGPATSDSYVIPQVPPGRRTLVIRVIDSDDSTIGRVLVQDSTRPEESLVNEPVNGETSLEGAVYLGVHLGQNRLPEGRFNPPQIALVHRFSEDVAGQAAMSQAELEALVSAYTRAQDILIRGFEAMTGGYDSLAVNAGVREFAQAYAEARHGGMPAPVAQDAFIDGAVTAYLERAGTPAQVATAWGAFATLHDAELSVRTTLTRLQSAQNLLHISVTARQALVETVPDATAGKGEVVAALDGILAAGMNATDMQAFVDAVTRELQEGAAELEAARGADFGQELQAADLSIHIDTSESPEEIACGLPEYLEGVESAADDASLAALAMAVMAGPSYSESGGGG